MTMRDLHNAYGQYLLTQGCVLKEDCSDIEDQEQMFPMFVNTILLGGGYAT